MKYEEVYFETEQKNLKAKDILELYVSHKSLFESYYHSHLWCPDCKQVQVGVVFSGGVHLRGYRTQEHLDECEHKQPEYITKKAETLNKSPEDVYKIQHQLEMLLRRTFAMQNTNVKQHARSTSLSSKANTTLLSHGKLQQNYRLPQKRIDVPLEKEDFTCVKIFYGIVSIEWNPRSRRLWLYSLDDKKRICGLKITEKVEPFLLKKNIALQNYAFAHISFAGKLEPLPDGRSICTLTDSRFMTLEAEIKS